MSETKESKIRLMRAMAALVGGIAFLLMLAPVVRADPPVSWHVAPGGTDTSGCGAITTPCLTINYAISEATVGATIAIASGTYTEYVNIDKRIILEGSGSGADGTILQNTGNSTTVVGANYSYSPVVILGASGLVTEPVLLKNIRIKPRGDLMAGQLPGILARPGMTISHIALNNVVITGTLQSNTSEKGLAVDGGSLTNLVIENCAFNNMAYGIIAYQDSTTPTIFSNVMISNTTFDNNSIKGIYTEKLSEATFNTITVTNNGDTSLSPDWADDWNTGIDINLKYADYQNIEFNDLIVTGNGIGSTNGNGLAIKARDDGGYASNPATLDGVTINRGTFTGNSSGGIYVHGVTALTLTNNIVAANRFSGTVGYGLRLTDTQAILLHTTIAENVDSGGGAGLWLEGTSTATLTNTILVSHTVGLTVANSSAVTLSHTLWHGNLADTGGTGAIISGTHVYGAPAFVGGGDYHIAPASAAIDAGTDAGVNDDIDAESRPMHAGYDIGADENMTEIALTASPASITANGLTTATLTATVTYKGIPQGDAPVMFTTSLGIFSNWEPTITVTTTAQGVAATWLRSLPSSGTLVSTVGANFDGTFTETQVTFTPNSCQADLTTWTERDENPIFGQGVYSGPKAYYPSILYSPTAFDGHGDEAYYKMWFGTSSSKTGYAISDDGLDWMTVTVPLTDINGYHAHVLYDADQFSNHGDAAYYKMWYWDVSSSVNYATSTNGIDWTDYPGNPVITNTLGWGSAPVYDAYVIYNDGGDPAYYEAWIDNNGKVYYITSTNGITWTGDNRELLIPRETWESSTYSRVSVIKQDATYHMWYGGASSGGGNHGIGYAISTDGQYWVKSANNPILYKDDGPTWRDDRTYTPRVLYSATRFDGHGTPEQYKMWFTGRDSADRNYAIGYATLNPLNLSRVDTSGSGQSGTVGNVLSQPFVVGLHDSCGEPASGVTVTFAISGTPVTASGQSLSAIGGTTNGAGQISSTLTLGNKPGTYTVTAQSTGVISMPVVFTATATPGLVHHFTFAPIGEQVETRPFTITVTAEDVFSNTVTAYTGPVTLTDSAGAISPTLSGAFSGGVLTQPAVINADGTDVVITATHTATPTIAGVSNSFDVLPLRVTNTDTGEWFVTIQKAIDDTSTVAGHTISATAGTYGENVTITKGITLTGISSATTVIDGGGAGNAVTVITHSVTLLNFTVRGGHQCGGNVAGACGGVVVDSGDDSTLLTGIHIAHNTVVSNAGNGIFIKRADGALIENNLIHYNGAGGNHAGISLIGGAWGSSNALVKNTIIRDNDVYSNTSYGVYAAYGAQGNVVEENRIHDNAKYGVEIIRFQPVEPLRDNVIRGNQIFDNDRNGIKLVNTVGGRVLTNTIASNGWGSAKPKHQYGVMLEGYNGAWASDNHLLGNHFVDNQGGGLILQGDWPITATIVRDNSFITSSVAISNNVPNSVTAAYNNWGVTDLAAIEDKIYHQADDPALGEVLYYDIALTDDGSSPMADWTSHATVTATLTGLLYPAGNVVSFTTNLGVLGAITGTTDAGGAVSTIITSTTGGTATITGTAGMTGDNPRSDATHVTFAPLSLDHFHIYLLQGQVAGVGFPVVIAAQDSANVTVVGFNSWAALTDTTTTLVPTTPIQFHNGVWNGSVTITQAYADDVITATYIHDPSKNGDSNAFDVGHSAAVSVTLAPASAAITAGQSITYTVAATDAHGNGWDATSEADYAIESGAGGSWTANAYAARISGAWPITATVDGASDTATLDVACGPADSIALSPSTRTATAGDAVAYAVAADDGYGNDWDVTSPPAAYAITSGAGGSWTNNTYTSQFIGDWTITATWNNLTDTATLHTITATVVEISLSPATATITAGQSIAYTVVATDTAGNSWDATAGTYFIVNSGAKGGWAGGTYTSEAIGNWAVTAVYGGQSDNAALAVTHAEAVLLGLSPTTYNAITGERVDYTVTVDDGYGNDWDATAEAVYTIAPGAGGWWMGNVYTSEIGGIWTVTATIDGLSGTAILTVVEHSLIINIMGDGSVTKNPDRASYTHGDIVTLTATADPGWSFGHWSGSASGTLTETMVTVDGDESVTAHFAQIEYTFTVDTAGSGSVNKNPDQATYQYGDVVTLTATADPGWSFDHWSGSASGTLTETMVTVDGDESVTATFTQGEYTLTVGTAGDGAGTVTPTVGTHVYDYGATVWLTATAGAGSTFAGWSEAVTGLTNPISVTMDGDKAVIATFELAAPAPPLVQFSSAAYSVDETAGAATITVTLGATSTLPVTVTYAASDGTATAGSDYTAISDLLRFDVGETIRTFTVPVFGDALVEGDETVMLTLSDPINAASGTTATLTIVDNVIYLPLVVRNYSP